VNRGEIWWADLNAPGGAGPGYRRPLLVVQTEGFNRSLIATTMCVVLTSNVRLAEAPGNVLIPARESGLPKDAVANVSQVVTVDKARMAARGEVATTIHAGRERGVEAGAAGVLTKAPSLMAPCNGAGSRIG
jgi:mRNA interferase MazF